MRLAFLGTFDEAAFALRAVRNSSAHSVTVAVVLPEDAATDPARWSDLLPEAVRFDSRGDLLQSDDFDAILLGTRDDASFETVRQLTSLGRGVILTGDADAPSARLPESTLLYELSLMRDDADLPLAVALPHTSHPAIEFLHDDLSRPTADPVRLLEVKTTRPPSGDGTLTEAEIATALLPDVAIARRLVTPYDRLTALYTGQHEAGFSRAMVTLAAEDAADFIWTIEPATEPEWSLRLIAGKTEYHLTIAPDRSAVLTTKTVRDEQTRTWTAAEATREAERIAITRIEESFSEERDDWSELIRCVEAVEATERSRRRQRTVNLNIGTLTERGLFKSQMTAIGCGLMSVTFVVVLGLLAIGAVFDVPERFMKVLRLLAFLPLVLFLLVQAVIIVIPQTTQPDESADESS